MIELLRKSSVGCRYGSQYMGMYCYADDLSLLFPTITGLHIMLDICETFANEQHIIFNAKKSQLLCFSANSNVQAHNISIKMKNGQSIPFVESCMHLGNELYAGCKHVLIKNAIKDLNSRLNCLMADFSHCDSSTLSVLFNTYCMNIYGSQLWNYNNKFADSFYTAWRKAIRIIWKVPYRTHNSLVHRINKSNTINIILEKRCIKFIWSLINSPHSMFNQLVKYSLFNMNTTIGENIRYFMYKFNFNLQDWHKPIRVIYKKIDVHVNTQLDYDAECMAMAVRDLCISRDIGNNQFFEHNHLKVIIDTLCTICFSYLCYYY